MVGIFKLKKMKYYRLYRYRFYILKKKIKYKLYKIYIQDYWLQSIIADFKRLLKL